jgi:hypothetical protein
MRAIVTGEVSRYGASFMDTLCISSMVLGI